MCAHCSRTENSPNEYMGICERVSAQMRSTYIKCNGTHFFTLRVYTFPLNCDTPQLNARIPKDPKQKRNKLDEEKKESLVTFFLSFFFVVFVSFDFISFHSISTNLLFEIWKTDREKTPNLDIEIEICLFSFLSHLELSAFNHQYLDNNCIEF